MDRAMRDIISASMENARPMPGDYPVNGILYCGRCNKPKEKRIEWVGKPVTVGIMCDCQQKKYDAEEKERRAQKIAINRMRAYGNEKMASKLSQKNFANCNPQLCNESAYEAIMDYADNYDKYRQQGKGLLLTGSVGTGKTYAALCILNKLLDECHTGLFTSFSRIADDLFTLRERREYIDTLTDYDAVVIDDLGAERSSEWMMEQVYSVVDAFIRAERPMIITTNLPFAEINDCKDISRQRIYSRILGSCKVVTFSGKDMRKEGVAQ